MRRITYLLFAALPLLFLQCDALSAEEVARASGFTVSNPEDLEWKTITVDAEAGDKLHIWSEMDLAYEGDLELRFQVQIIKGADTLGLVEMDPFDKNINMGEVKTEVMGKTNWRFSGRMRSLIADEGATYTLRSILVASANETLQLKKADLIIKK